ncbi:MAG: hypothetical protein PHR47_00070 [Candidatus Pacebacteria bacterium]|nr:hypothetical protein [Candidatus Paceibacterota bacterium]
MKNIFKLASKWNLVFKVLPFVIAIVILKFITHYFGIEFLSLNSLFTAIISANIFLIGFLISGVLVDYKESEKIPGDLAASLETIADECDILIKNKKELVAKNLLSHVLEFSKSMINWFYKKEKTTILLDKLSNFNGYFLELESQTQANFITRLKQEQNLIRKMIHRIHTIRETSFLGTGYAIAEIITILLVTGMIFIKMDPYYESIFFVAFVSFILIYMIYFIKDLDNPFGYSQKDHLVEEVPLKPLIDLQERIGKKLHEID